jgi:hypothetical protein
MKKNKCQAFTKKKKPCQNYAMEGSQFCHIHNGFFKNFPPVKITALMCPYCDEPLRREAKYCKFCKNPILTCPYCGEPLRKDAEFCNFCKEALNPVIPEPDKLNYYGMLIDIRNWVAAKSRNIKYGCFWVVAYFLIALLACIIILGIVFEHFS